MRAIIVSVAAALWFAGGACAPGVIDQPLPSEGKGFSPIPMVPDVVERLRAEGKAIKVPFPATASRAKKFNVRGGAIPPLQTAADQKVLVLFANFTDVPMGAPETPRDLTDFDNLLFGTVYDPVDLQYIRGYGIDYPTDRTLLNFYQEISYGQVEIVTANLPSSLGWSNVGKPYSAYCKADGMHDNGFGLYPNNVQGLVVDTINAAKAAHPELDFADYAVNGVIPNLFVVFRGTGAEWSGTGELIWSHSWDLSEGTGMNGFVVDGVKINNYAMMPELNGDPMGFGGAPFGPYPATVGVYAHEYGHVLGLPDLYDYGYESEGVGNFSLMAGGSWNTYPAYLNFYGNSPAHPDAWNRIRLGFVTPVEITADADITLAPAVLEPVIYKVAIPGSTGAEYYLLENRQPWGFDQGFALMSRGLGAPHGLAVYHVDDAVMARNYWRCNEAENWKENRFASGQKAWNGETHYGVSMLQADGLWHLERGTGYGDSGDLYPGRYGRTRLGDDTSPNTTTYGFYGPDPGKWGHSGISLEDIVESDGIVSAKVRFAQ